MHANCLWAFETGIQMASKPLFGDLIASHKDLAEELKTVDVAADLTLLLQHAGVSREVLASKLGWSGDRLSQVLSGHENITVQTIAAVAGALGYTFDVVFRKTDAPLTLNGSDEVRAKLTELGITETDTSAAVDWARAQAPTT
jgi:transcriptional regulator with XRE-family HTH domain